MSKVTLTNMCMVYNKETNEVLVQERVKSWKGIAFPGGHVEDGESLIDSAIREIREETGLIVSNLEPCGIIHWYNDETGEKYFVFNYRTEVYSGELVEQTDEGSVFWVNKSELPSLQLSDGMRERLPMFLDKKYSEGYGVWNKAQESQMKWL
ncbi:8-oxo-dGTP diphosphatase [Paenibacillus glycanilyticus]|uniref:7,8-dihydro-8-oxoguanine triphosphatase n=1 Tax=Paenibacillus glycanilyticus TaxID=126569 RepID=A0ABQ6GHU4_9BACL|nr:8-oxo-dGTP diphosphatase [Paenibacillus glycanilyticus]GLX70519.1 7,8-dihydro-8-oxoguanine triphosphatase [Paenibacillus glycanilyticus]